MISRSPGTIVSYKKIRTKSEAFVGLEWGAFVQDGVERRQKGAYYITIGKS